MKTNQQTNSTLNKTVFLVSSIISIVLIVTTLIFPIQAKNILNNLFVFIVQYFDWYYILIIVVYILFCIIIALSKYGTIKLGQDQDKADFSYVSWEAMLFSAGIGIDLLFFSVYEPLSQFINPIEGEALTQQAAKKSIETTLLHWGIHGWVIYALVGMTLAYFAYRKKQPLALRSALTPIFGRKLTQGWVGNLTDSFGVICTLLGITTSLGIGVLQLNAGMSHVLGISTTTLSQIALIIFIIGAATLSAVSGLKKGIKYLSIFNMILALLLILVVLFFSNTLFLLNAIILNIGDYFQNIISNSFNTYAYLGPSANTWKGSWTIFFWAWWIAWAPFVGLFIARISHGRTIREFTFGILFIPLGFVVAWFCIFGNAAIEYFNLRLINQNAINQPEMGLFMLLEQLPLSLVWSIIAIISAMLFFITSADSATLVLSNLCSKNLKEDQDAPIQLRVFWAVCLGLITLGILLAGGFESLQSIAILAGLPFSIVIILYMVSLTKSLSTEVTYKTVNYHAQTANWQERLDNLLAQQPVRQQKIITQFNPIVQQAISEIVQQLHQNNVLTEVEHQNLYSHLKIFDQNSNNYFFYEIKVSKYVRPAKLFLFPSPEESRTSLQIAVKLLYQSYTIEDTNLHKDFIVLDILNRYEDYLNAKQEK
ncbi:MAG: BCCT family transporter [Neisseriaceae bacterium]|nr:BCCT family transporter [Neisseriaceae bacterium]